MDAGDPWASLSEFTLAEIVELESIYKEIGEESLNPEYCRGLAAYFSCSSNRIGKPALTWEQVRTWFLDKRKEPQATVTSSMALELFFDLSGVSNDAPESSQNSKGAKVSDLSELAFEAKSSRDNAWYDVGSFLTYRVLCSGELEVRVRFAGFSNTDDEWVNVRKAVRQRSIPLEASECHRVKVGDLVLCFKEREDQAVYCDARVVEIQRRLHDIRGCRCIFVVRYYHDNSEEKVQLGRLCCRPTKISEEPMNIKAKPHANEL